MADRLFKRLAKVTVWRDTIVTTSTFNTKPLIPGERLEITDMRIRFRVERSLTKTPNQTDIYIYNLSRSTRTDLETRPLTVQLNAGYDNVDHLLSIGDLHFGMSELQAPDWETLLQVGDGDRAYNHARVNRSYKPGTTVRTIITDAAASMGLQLPRSLSEDPDLDKQAVTGAASHGPTRDELTRWLAPFGYHWSIQNGQLQVLKDGQPINGNSFPVDQDHGMIGTPEFGAPPRSGKPPHMRVKMLLYPELAPGCLVKVTSIAKSGLFRVEKVRHTGDTHGDEWTTEIEILPY